MDKNFKQSIIKSFMNHAETPDILFPGEYTTRRLAMDCNQKAIRKYLLKKPESELVPDKIGGYPATKDLNKFVMFGAKNEIINDPIFDNTILEMSKILSTMKTVIGTESAIPIPFTRNPVLYKFPYQVINMHPDDKILEDSD